MTAAVEHAGPTVEDPAQARSPRAALLPAVVLLGLLAVFAAAWAARIVETPDRWLWNFDMPKIDYPLAVYAHEALANGQLPLWNDRLGLGFPLYAEGQVAPFYPPSWIAFQLSPFVALDLYRVMHLAFAGLGAGLLVLRIRGSRPGAVVAVLVAILGGAIVAKLEWHNLVAAYAWLPWILLPLVRQPRPTRQGLVTSGVLFGVQALAGHPNTWLLTGIVVGVVLVAGRDGPIRGAGRALIVGALGAAVGAVQLIPTAVLTTLSVRSNALSSSDLFASAATPFDLLGLGFQGAFAPIEQGSWNVYQTWYPDGGFALLEAAVYVGLPVVGLALSGALLRRPRALAIAAAVLIAIPIVEAFKPEVIQHIPLINGLRSPVRAYLPASLLLGVLAGCALGRRPSVGLRVVPIAIGVAIPVAAFVASVVLVTFAPAVFDQVVLAFTTFGNAESVARNRQLAVAALRSPWPLYAELLAGVAIIVVAAAAGSGLLRRRAASVAAIVAAVPLLLMGPIPNMSSEVAAFTSRDSEFITAVKGVGPHRMLAMDPQGWYAGTANMPSAAGIPDLRMVSSLNLADVEAMTVAAAKADDAGATLRRALGVDVPITFQGPCPGTEVARAVSAQASICVDDAALRPPYWVPNDAVSVVLPAEGLVGTGRARLDPARAVASAVPLAVQSRDDQGLHATVTAPSDGWVWIDRAWWPGWITTVDGARVDTLEALGGQLVPVTAGSHVVEQALVPIDALAGLALGVGALVLAGLWVRRGRGA